MDDEKPNVTGEHTLQASMMYERSHRSHYANENHTSDFQIIFLLSKILTIKILKLGGDLEEANLFEGG